MPILSSCTFRLETLILVDNSITEIPSTLQLLAKLQTLWYDMVANIFIIKGVLIVMMHFSLDGNLLHEVDPVLKTMDSIRSNLVF